MKAKLISILLGFVLDMLTPEQLKEFADNALDFVENKVAESDSPLDDTIVLPIIEMIRKAFDIPDND